MTNNNHFEQTELKEKIREVALSPDILRLTEQVASESVGENRFEQGGFLGGVVRNGTFLVWDNEYTANGTEGECTLYDQIGAVQGFREIDVDFFRRRLLAIPDFKTVRYHSHPRVTQEVLNEALGEKEARKVIDYFRKELELGIFSSVGITTLDDAINESLSRQLSKEDLDRTKGRYHLLVSPTQHGSRNLFSHLNFYDLSFGGESILPVRIAQQSELAHLLGIEEKVREKWKIANFGSDDFDTLTQEQLDEAYEKIHHSKLVFL